MTVASIYEILDSLSPFSLQAKWDNSGLNLGCLDSVFQEIYLSLELDWKVLESISDDSLLIVHHPLIFSPLKSLDTSQYPGNLIQAAIKKNIALIAMHTNFDLSHLNEAFAASLGLDSLGFSLEASQEFSLIYKPSSAIMLASLASHIKAALSLEVLRYSGEVDSVINRIFITCGSNAASYRLASRGDCIITGDLKYHDAMMANSLGISFIDVPHFESECIFGGLLQGLLKKQGLQARIANSHNPFRYI